MATVTDVNNNSTSNIDNDVVPTNSLGLDTIGMDGSSGHSCCKKNAYASFLMATITPLVLVIQLPQMFVAFFRCDATGLYTLVLIMSIVPIFFSPVIAWVVDADICGSCFGKIGMPTYDTYDLDENGKVKRDADGKMILKKMGYGKRASVFAFCMAFCAVISFFIYSPPSWAILATVKDGTRLLNEALGYNNITHYKYGESGEWQKFEPTMDIVNGFDCSQKLYLNTTGIGKVSAPWTTEILPDGTEIVSFTAVRLSIDQTTEIPAYGNDICESMISSSSVCWPGPTGSTKPGDGGARVCSYMDNNSILTHTIIISILMYVFVSTANLTATSAVMELYPWNQERMQVFGMVMVWVLLAVAFYVVVNTLAIGESEFTTKPDGNQSFRSVAAIVCGILVVLFSIAPLWPLREARQQQKNSKKVDNFFAECKNAFLGDVTGDKENKSAGAMRIMTLLGLVGEIRYQLRVIGQPFVFIYIFKLTPEWIASAGIIGGIGILIRLFFAGVWSWVFGTKSKKGREHSRDPRLISMVCLTILSFLQFIIIGAMWQPRSNEHTSGWPEVMALLVWGVVDQTLISVYSFWLTAAGAWIVDEDCQYQITRGGKRREGFYKAIQQMVNGVATFIAVAWINSFLIGDNAPCNTNYQYNNQKPECGQSFFILFLVFHPILRLIQVLLMYFFPITGERLKALYRRQAVTHVVVGGSSAEKELIELKKMKSQFQKETAALTTQAPATFKVVLPDGAAPGMQLQYPLSNGTNVTVVVPEGKGPGDELLVPIPPVTTTTINAGDNKGTGTI